MQVYVCLCTERGFLFSVLHLLRPNPHLCHFLVVGIWTDSDDSHSHICFCFRLDAVLKFSKTHHMEEVTAGVQSLGNRKEKKETETAKKLVAKLLSVLADFPA